MLAGTRRGDDLRIIAHRGGRGFGTDNTLDAMRTAVRAGVRELETDVRQTADGQLVICHDAIIRGRTVSRMTFDDLRKHSPDRTLLSDLLEELAGWCVFNLEIKEADEAAIGEALETYGITADTLVSSFDMEFLLSFKRGHPEVKTGLLYRMHYGQGRKLQNGLTAGADVVLPHFGAVDDELVEHAHGMGLEVYTWTVNDIDDAKGLEAIGVDAIITDRYLELKAALQA
jgi:glycerophosphoryl diester phosphodiesterase